MMQHRIIGFDLARAYAIFGMYIVNFTFCFGNFADQSIFGRFNNLFIGNSTSIFILCAGMGLSLMTNRPEYSSEEKLKLKSIVLKRSWFLFAIGLLLYNWWPGDILHFYGGYMHIAAFLIFLPQRYYLWAALLALTIFHFLLFVIPVTKSWNLATCQYADFWTLEGFLRNTFYNGWNSIFPWFSYFALGMWLGRLNWQSSATKRNTFLAGFLLFSLFEGLRVLVKNGIFTQHSEYIMSDYFPAYIPYIMITTGFALMVISICMYIGDKFSQNIAIVALVKTGQMTLTHYISHITIGMIIVAGITQKHYTGLLEDEMPTLPEHILMYAIAFFITSVIFSFFWRKKFKNGPIEMIMRKISD
jgi:uncharacterized membrane protein YeiB